MPQDPADGGLIVFLRLPQWGKVKTRLAATAGHDAALTIYRKLISRTLNVVSESEQSVYLFYDGGLPPTEERIPGFAYHLQSQGKLGLKMAEAISYVLQFHTRATIIGSDCPTMSALIINKSFALLDTHDIVLGPAMDGGYYLFGCKKLVYPLFEDIPWSTSSVLEETIVKINAARLSYTLLEPLLDIDTSEDWEQYIRSGN